ncbi:metallophosphoesterase [Bdellovibrionota bacterium FG-1]
MRVAVISDLHGNYRALEAVIEDISRQNVDLTVCAGDIIDPFRRSLETWLKLKSLKIPCLRGNHEDYSMIYHHRPDIRPEIRTAVHFKPVQLVAQHLGPVIASELGALPLSYTVPGPGGDDLFICHASPLANNRSFIYGIDEDLSKSLRSISASTIVAGHIHQQWVHQWSDKTLILAGSLGLPLSGTPEAEYLIMEYRKSWTPVHRKIPYDQAGALAEYAESGWLVEGGPIAWLLYDELRCAWPRLAHFIPDMLKRADAATLLLEDWQREARRYLLEVDGWERIQGLV